MKLNLDNPTLTFSRSALLRNGQEISVMGSTFSKSIMPLGESMHTLINLVDKDGESIGVAFYREQMNEDDLRANVEETALEPDKWLSPGHKQKIEN